VFKLEIETEDVDDVYGEFKNVTQSNGNTGSEANPFTAYKTFDYEVSRINVMHV